MAPETRSTVLLTQSRVKEIPADWTLQRVGDVLEICNNLRKPISADERSTMQGSYPYYGPTKIQDWINEYRLDGKYALIGEDGDHFLKFRTMPMTQLVVGRFNVNNHAHIVKGTKVCSSEWFYQYFKHREISAFLTRQGAGRYKLNKESLQRIPILVPPQIEQRRIVEVLSTWDRVIETVDDLIANSERRKQAVSRLVFNNHSNSKTVVLGDVAKLQAGGTPSTKKPEYWDGDIPWMSSGDINLRQLTDVDGRISKLGLTNSSARMLPMHCVLVALAGQGSTRGKVAVNLIKLATNQSVAAITPSAKIDYEYLFHNLDSRYRELRALSLGDGGRGGLNLSILRGIKIPLPELGEQREVAQLLSRADYEQELLSKFMQRIQLEKRGLMQQLLTGKRRLKGSDDVDRAVEEVAAHGSW